MFTVAEASSQKGQHSLRSRWQWNQVCAACCCQTGDGNTELHKNDVREMPSDFRLTDYCPKQASATELPLLYAGILIMDQKKKKKRDRNKTGLTTDAEFLKKYIL